MISMKSIVGEVDSNLDVNPVHIDKAIKEGYIEEVIHLEITKKGEKLIHEKRNSV